MRNTLSFLPCWVDYFCSLITDSTWTNPYVSYPEINVLFNSHESGIMKGQKQIPRFFLFARTSSISYIIWHETSQILLSCRSQFHFSVALLVTRSRLETDSKFKVAQPLWLRLLRIKNSQIIVFLTANVGPTPFDYFLHNCGLIYSTPLLPTNPHPEIFAGRISKVNPDDYYC